MVNAMGLSMTDPRGAAEQKLDFLRKRANFRAKLAEEMDKRNMSYRQFEGTQEFQDMFDDYKKQLESIGPPRGRISGGSSAAPIGATPKQSGSYSAASQKTREILGIR